MHSLAQLSIISYFLTQIQSRNGAIQSSPSSPFSISYCHSPKGELDSYIVQFRYFLGRYLEEDR